MALDAERAHIFRITHIENVEWDIEHGLQCRNSPLANPNFRNIGNLDLIEKRKTRLVPMPPWGTLSDYIPFYFTSRSPMLLNIKTGYNDIPRIPMADIVIYAASLRDLAAAGVPFVYTDRHAKLEFARFSNDLKDLDRIDWGILNASDFKRDPAYLDKMDRYQAETLVHRELPCASLGAIVCYNDHSKAIVTEVARRHGLEKEILVRPRMYF